MNQDLFNEAKDFHKEKHKENTKKARQLLTYNRKKIYKLVELTKKYEALRTVLTPVLTQDLLDIITFWLKHECIGYGKHEMVYFLSTYHGTYAVRRKTTKGVTNRRLNYLCAIGLLRKLEQVISYGYDPKERRFLRRGALTDVNRNLLRNKDWKLEPINTFEVFKYTTEVLEECNRRAERLLKAKITSGNISYNQLANNGLEDIAHEVYLEDRALSVEKKQIEFEILTNCIDFLIEEKGYTTKKEIYDNCPIENAELDKLFKIFKNNLWKTRLYKAPNKDEKELYNLKSKKWIITKKE